VLVYALAGAGLYATTLPGDDNGYAYQFGGGIEVAVTDAITVRGDLVGIGAFDDGNDDAFDSARATVGLAYHF
jgi:outer membrane immunogenic protein